MDISSEQNHNIPKTYTRPTRVYVLVVSFTVLFLFLLYICSAPNASESYMLHVSRGESIETVGKKLYESNSIRSVFLLKVFVFVLGGDRVIEIGDYSFEKNTPMWKIAWMLGHGVHNVDPVKITIPEGFTNDQMAMLFAKSLPNFDITGFKEKTKDMQGYLFPDTYFFYPLTTTDEIIASLSHTFDRRIASLQNDITQSERSREDIIVMASIIEEEAKGDADREMIAGILWKRIDQNMMLQVDVDRSTYESLGLPSMPISNPGRKAILAAINPKESPYLFYLHDKQGRTHYALTYKEHKNNITQYLK